jgi:hypothetical protein
VPARSSICGLAAPLAVIVLLSGLLLTTTSCTRVRKVTRYDALGRPVVTTYKRGPGGTMEKQVVRGEEPAQVPGWKFGGRRSELKTSSSGTSDLATNTRRTAPSRNSIFSGGGTWYVNGKKVESPDKPKPAAPPIPFVDPPKTNSEDK